MRIRIVILWAIILILFRRHLTISSNMDNSISTYKQQIVRDSTKTITDLQHQVTDIEQTMKLVHQAIRDGRLISVVDDYNNNNDVTNDNNKSDDSTTTNNTDNNNDTINDNNTDNNNDPINNTNEDKDSNTMGNNINIDNNNTNSGSSLYADPHHGSIERT